MKKIINFLEVEIANVNNEIHRNWQYLQNEVQYKSLKNIEPFLIQIKKLESRIVTMKILIERAGGK